MTDHPLTDEKIDELCAVDTDPARFARAAFDAGREHERANPEDARPWEPLAGPVRVGYEVRRELNGVTTTAVVGRMGAYGDPWTAEGAFIGVLEIGTWYVRRTAAQELPTKLSTVIVPAGDHETITATDPETGTVWRTREAACISALYWMGVWRDEDGTFSSVIPAAWIDADTWQEDNK